LTLIGLEADQLWPRSTRRAAWSCGDGN